MVKPSEKLWSLLFLLRVLNGELGPGLGLGETLVVLLDLLHLSLSCFFLDYFLEFASLGEQFLDLISLSYNVLGYHEFGNHLLIVCQSRENSVRTRWNLILGVLLFRDVAFILSLEIFILAGVDLDRTLTLKKTLL